VTGANRDTLPPIFEPGSEAAPPRTNGELVFEAPWEARAFGLTLALIEGGVFAHDEFRTQLIAEIGAWEARHGADTPYCYYERWLAALERVLEAKGLSDREQLDAFEDELSARPTGHDHAHPHD
jgi:nitrile hydratase accessory protein